MPVVPFLYQTKHLNQSAQHPDGISAPAESEQVNIGLFLVFIHERTIGIEHIFLQAGGRCEVFDFIPGSVDFISIIVWGRGRI